MGSVYRQQVTRPLPVGAEVVTKGGERVARWRVRGRVRTAPVSAAGDRVLTTARTFTAKYRDHTGAVVTRATGCKDEQAARQMLAKWEREAEQVKAGTLDAAALGAARKGAAPLADHLAAYERSLVATGVSDVYRKNVLRAVRKVAADCGFASPADFRREAVEDWLAARVGEGMGARTRNAYREGVVAFLNWCRGSGRLAAHDLDRVPKADQKADPRRQRRSLTEAELTCLLAVAANRPLTDARTVRRGKRKGEACAELTDATVVRLRAVGRERALVYKSLVLTGLRRNELRTLTVGQLDLTPGAAFLQLDAADEKSREGNSLPIRDDLAADLRGWLADRLADIQSRAAAAGEPIPARVPSGEAVFDVPLGLVRILDRDLKAAGIPKRDDRGRTVDVHAMRTTFGTLLSKTGTAPRTAQAAMRHSDIKLTMGVYTDPRLLDIRGAVDRLPALILGGDSRVGEARRTGTSGGRESVTPGVTPAPVRGSHFGASRVREGGSGESENEGGGGDGSAYPVNEKPPVTTGVIGGHRVGLTGFEPATSWSRTKRSTKLSYSPSPAAGRQVRGEILSARPTKSTPDGKLGVPPG